MDLKKTEEAFTKEVEPIRKKIAVIMKEITSCPNCKETDVKFIMCQKHKDELKELNKEAGDIQFSYQLKMELHKEEIMKEREKLLKEMMQKNKTCASCQAPHK